MSLSSLIVHREIATVREVEEALARQVLYGGDLVTNLLEVTRLDEAQITPLLAESFGRIAAPSGELPAPSEEARALTEALRTCQGNVLRTAQHLGIDRRQFYRLLSKHGIDPAAYRK